MNNLFNRQFNMLSAVIGFSQRYSGLFPANGLAASLFAVVAMALPELHETLGVQSSSMASNRAGSSSKAEARAELLHCLDVISVTARSIARVDSSVGDKFKMPRDVSDQALIGHALGFVDNATQLKDEFLSHDMDPEFIDELKTAINRFKDAVQGHVNAKKIQTSATGNLATTLQKVLDAIYRLDGIVPNTLRKNGVSLSEWDNVRKVPRARVASRSTTDAGNTQIPAVPLPAAVPPSSSAGPPATPAQP